MGKGRTMSGKISVVIVKDTMGYVAVGLEHYIAAQGDSEKEVMANFFKTLFAELIFCFENDLGAFEGIEAAPQEYWDMYRAGAKGELASEDGLVSQDEPAVGQPIEAFQLPKAFQLPMIDCRVAA